MEQDCTYTQGSTDKQAYQKTAEDNAEEEMANSVQFVSQCHRQEEAAGPFVHLD